MNIGTIQSIWTIVVIVIFVWIIVWAWSGKRRKSFDEASRIPLEDETSLSSGSCIKEKNHG